MTGTFQMLGNMVCVCGGGKLAQEAALLRKMLRSHAQKLPLPT